MIVIVKEPTPLIKLINDELGRLGYEQLRYDDQSSEYEARQYDIDCLTDVRNQLIKGNQI